MLSSREVNEIADTPRGVTVDALKRIEHQQTSTTEDASRQATDDDRSAASAPTRSAEAVEQEVRGTSQSFARVGKDGKVVFEKPAEQRR